MVGLTLSSKTLLTHPLEHRKEEAKEIGQTVRVQISKPEYWLICPWSKHFIHYFLGKQPIMCHLGFNNSEIDD